MSFAHTAAATPHARASREDDPAFANTAPPSRAAEIDGVACVAVPIGVGALYVWWRGADDVEGEIVVRVAVIIPTWDGPRREIRDIHVDARAGGIGIRGLPEHAVARVAIGCVHDGAFTPIAHSPAIEAEARRGLVRWTLEGHVPLALDDPRIAGAVEAARRA